MKTVALLCLVSFGLAGCVSMTPRAQQVQLLSSDSDQLAHCKELGPLSADASGLTQMNPDDVDQQAKNNLRDAAAAKWGAGVDSVVLTGVDRKTTKAVANGVAYKCH
jgi:hypothetical protein